jgi:ADP-heptose:LPS heptosyltransferase
LLQVAQRTTRSPQRRERPPLELSGVHRIGVVRALPGLGDLLCAVPALRALRAAAPRARVTLVGLPSARWFVERFPLLVDELLPVEGWPGLPEAPARPGSALQLVRAGRQRRFDVVVQLHGDGRVTNALAAALGATWLVAPEHARGRPPDIPAPFDETDPEVLRLLDLAERAGAPAAGAALELPLSAADRAAAAALLAGVDRPFVVLHPGSSTPRRRWDAASFAWIGQRVRQSGHAVVVTGTADERGVVGEVAAGISGTVLDLAGRTPDVGTLGAVVERAALVVCNDTGVSHVAAALRTPSVIVFHTPETSRWAPLARTLHVPVVIAGSDPETQRARVADAVDGLLALRQAES